MRGGLRYNVTSYFSVGIGGEETRTKFPQDPRRADNESTAVLVTVHYDRPRLFVNFSGGYRMGRPIDGSEFSRIPTFTGSGYVTYELIPDLESQRLRQRAINYGLFLEQPLLPRLDRRRRPDRARRAAALDQRVSAGTERTPIRCRSTGIQRVDKVTIYGGGVDRSALQERHADGAGAAPRITTRTSPPSTGTSSASPPVWSSAWWRHEAPPSAGDRFRGDRRRRRGASAGSATVGLPTAGLPGSGPAAVGCDRRVPGRSEGPARDQGPGDPGAERRSPRVGQRRRSTFRCWETSRSAG